ncbi:MAG: flagellar basal-body MS-ring/collar protein FliF [Pseudohongiellaceae bacterium]|jgi:flagellar M-ring protein FliF
MATTTVQESGRGFQPATPPRSDGAAVARNAPGALSATAAQQQLNQASKFPSVVEVLAQPLVRKSLPGIVLVLLLVLFFVLYSWISGGEYRSLYPEMAEADRSEAYEMLLGSELTARLNPQTGSIEVPVDQYHEARLMLAAAGLPRQASADTLASFDVQSAMTTSQFMEEAKYLATIENELAKSIVRISSIESARVHIAAPRQSAFVRNRTPTKASVVVAPFPGRTISQSQVQAITYLVSSSVPYLAVNDVSVVDQMGNLLTNALTPTLTEATLQSGYERSVEEGYKTRIEQLLEPLVGRQNLRTDVDIVLDFTQLESTSEQFDPEREGPLTRSEVLSEDRSSTAAAAGVPGATTNVAPNDTIVTPLDQGQAATAAQNGQTVSTRSTRNFELDRTLRYQRNAQGQLLRMSVAVVLNDGATLDAEGAPRPLDEAALESIRSLIQGAVGYDATRGDQITVITSPFRPLETIENPVIWYEDASIVSLIRLAAVTLAFVLFTVLVIRPVIRVYLPKPEEVLDKPRVMGDGELSEEDRALISVGDGETLEEIKAKLKPKKSTISADMLDTANSYDDKVALIRLLVAEDSGRVANVLKKMIKVG